MADISKCAGQDETGKNICAYRQSCKRYIMPSGYFQSWASFWKTADDDCKNYIPIIEPKV